MTDTAPTGMPTRLDEPARAPRRKLRLHIAVFLAPAVLIYTIFSIYPLIESLRLSLQSSVPGGEADYVGLANYAKLFFDPLWADQFLNALRNNVVMFCTIMVVQNPIGLVLAALLSLPKVRFTGTYRTLLFMPTLLSVVIIGFVWQIILSPLWGVTDGFLRAIGFAHAYKPWLGLEGSALFTLSMISVWQYVGVPMMLIYAALLSIPDELIDAARIDGLRGWAIFWKVKLPLILPTLGLVGILTYIGNFTVSFDLIYAVQGALAGPDFSTDVMGTFLFRTFFGQQTQLGDPHMGATVASVLFFIILAGVSVYLLAVQRRLQRYEM